MSTHRGPDQTAWMHTLRPLPSACHIRKFFQCSTSYQMCYIKSHEYMESEGPDQPRYLSTLIRVFIVNLENT